MPGAIRICCFSRVLLLVAGLAAVIIVASCSRKSGTNETSDATTSEGDVKTTKTGDPKTDAVAIAVRKRIASEPNIRSKIPQWRDFTPTVNVIVNNGIVELRGKVAMDEETVAAGNAALSVAGVRGVANYLVAVGGQRMGTQDSSPPRPRSEIDASISAVLQSILADPKVTGKVQV